MYTAEHYIMKFGNDNDATTLTPMIMRVEIIKWQNRVDHGWLVVGQSVCAG